MEEISWQIQELDLDDEDYLDLIGGNVQSETERRNLDGRNISFNVTYFE